MCKIYGVSLRNYVLRLREAWADVGNNRMIDFFLKRKNKQHNLQEANSPEKQD
jgi:hypothetical protein